MTIYPVFDCFLYTFKKIEKRIKFTSYRSTENRRSIDLKLVFKIKIALWIVCLFFDHLYFS